MPSTPNPPSAILWLIHCALAALGFTQCSHLEMPWPAEGWSEASTEPVDGKSDTERSDLQVPPALLPEDSSFSRVHRSSFRPGEHLSAGSGGALLRFS